MTIECDLTFVEGCTDMFIRYDRKHLLDNPIEHPLVAGWNRTGLLTLAGPVGTGKTTMAWQHGRRFLIDGSLHLSVTAPPVFGDRAKRLLVHIATTRLSDDHEGVMDPLWQAMHAGLLVLDDLGVENLTDAQHAYLDEIIDDRVGSSKPTVITTNLNQDEFERRYGARIASRVLASGNDWINVLGDDRRRHKDISREEAGLVPGRLVLVDVFNPEALLQHTVDQFQGHRRAAD